LTIINCQHCGDPFEKSPRHPTQRHCFKKECKRAQKSEWQRDRKKQDPEYRKNQNDCQQSWLKRNPDYYRIYRSKNPEKVERNNLLQEIRNQKRVTKKKRSVRKNRSIFLIAKMDRSKINNFGASGEIQLEKMIAKMDSSKYFILRL